LVCQQDPNKLKLILLCAGEKTVHWEVAYKALKELGVDCFSALCQGGNQPLDEFLDPNHPSMKFWTAFADFHGYFADIKSLI
jgi:hypothetical protein